MGGSGSVALVVFAKVPGLGLAKSRIARASDPATAERVYEELLCATARNLAGRSYVVAFAGDGGPERLKEFFSESAVFFAQEGRDLGERMRRAAERLLAEGHRATIIVGTDCPTLSPRDLDQAVAMLTGGVDVVLGPALDGGYYLVGCNIRGLCVFSAKYWSLPGLLEETLEIIKRNQLSFHLLEPRVDIDRLSDYHLWKESGA
jgi:uncharacterized protein